MFRGQALCEYLLGVVCVALVLFVPLFDGRSVAGALANALHDGFATLSYLLSLC
jgi:hypothetical protein